VVEVAGDLIGAPASRKMLGAMQRRASPRAARASPIQAAGWPDIKRSRDVELRTTRSADSVATASVASDRRDRSSDPVYVALVLWRA
jgi:hypothetical protein